MRQPQFNDSYIKPSSRFTEHRCGHTKYCSSFDRSGGIVRSSGCVGEFGRKSGASIECCRNGGG